MKKASVILFFVFQSVWLLAQVGFTPNAFGEFYKRDLTNPTNATFIGTTLNQIGASDFNKEGVLFVISGIDNGLYILDTTNASSTLVATLPPTGSEFWTGMACDPTDGTMYVCSTDGNNSSLLTLNTETGETTLIGTGAVEDGLVGIAFDNTGQMYGIYLVRKFYSIDKTTGQATYIGDFNTAVSGLPHHGLDFDPQTETMYMTSYNVFTFDNELWTIDLSTGANTLVGSVGIWTGTVAVRPPAVLAAAFSADATEICAGESIAFMDESTGSPESWLWTFEGGEPASSTEQNPVVSYNSEGTYDVTLEVTNGSGSNNLIMTDFITVFSLPAPAVQGPDTVCTGHTETYFTDDIAENSYQWEVTGGDIINGAGTSEIMVQWGMTGDGSVVVTETSPNCEAASEVVEVFIDPCTLVDDHIVFQQRLSPNPASSEIRVNLKGLDVINIDVINSSGQIVLQMEITGNESQTVIDISALKPGVYMLQASSKRGAIDQCKFVKSK